MNIIHFDKNGNVIKDISKATLPKEFYIVLKKIYEKKR